jgi:hypothetical protein
MATFEAHSDAKKFYAHREVDGVDESFPIRFQRNMVIVKTKWGNVVFTKTNRGQSFTDSREPKKRIGAHEIKSELERLLDTKEQAEQAFQHLMSA